MDYKDYVAATATHPPLVDFALSKCNMGWPKKYKTPEEEAAQLEARCAAIRERLRRLRANPEYRAEVAAGKHAKARVKPGKS